MANVAHNEVLFVEDSDLDFETACVVLASHKWNLKVNRVSRAADLFTKLAACKAALIIMDLKLPDGDGIDLVARLRQRAELANTPIVVFSTSVNPGDETAALAAGANEFCTKPVDVSRYLHVVNDFVVKWLSDRQELN